MTTSTTTEKTMTAKQFFSAILEYDLPVELTAYAEKEIKKIEDNAQKRKDKPSKAQQENAVIRQTLFDYLVAHLSEEYFSQAELGEALGISPNKAGALARQLVKDGLAESTDVKVKGGTRKGYRAIKVEE